MAACAVSETVGSGPHEPIDALVIVKQTSEEAHLAPQLVKRTCDDVWIVPEKLVDHEDHVT